MENLIKKQTTIRFGEKRYLLGIRKKDNKKVYLTEASWDCGWYWGFGYVNAFTSRDICDHQHFDSLFLNNNIYDSFKEYFKETPLTNDEIWALLGYMKEFYIMREYSDMLHSGNHITSKAKNILQEKNQSANNLEYTRINEVLMPELFEKIYKLLEG